MGVAATLLWILLMFAAGVIAARYIERTNHTVAGFLLYGLAAFCLSLVRAHLHRRIAKRPAAGLPPSVVPNLIYLLLAISLYLVLSLLACRPADPVLFIPLCIGALLPDLDSKESVVGRLARPVSQRLEARLGHRQEWHSLAANALVALVTAPLIVVNLEGWALISLGFLVHLLADTLGPEGIMLFWPITRRRYRILGLVTPGSTAERTLAAVLTVVAVILLMVVDLGRAPAPPAAVPSFEQTLQRYYSMRGRNLVFARVEGSWQATGRRASGQFEVLNAVGESFIMLDRYDGKVFTAGRGPSDNFYLSTVSLWAGSPVRIKPVEVHLEGGYLGEALPSVYEMQREPGLQHMTIAGDVVLPVQGEVVSPTLQVDYAQTRLRKIQAQEPGHYTLHYLTASELIDLANLRVETADLLIVATYATPATGPTVTPLPSPPSARDETG
jgi:inner membrane protein